MLAQNFKTPVELKISSDEFDALVKVLGMLERGELTHARRVNAHYEATSKRSFHMAISEDQQECGTIACIGGWVAIVMNTDAQSYVEYRASQSLQNLYWPHMWLFDVIEPEHAAIAVRNFLTHGEPRWVEAIESELCKGEN